MIERNPRLINEQDLFTDLNERIEQIKQRQRARQEILGYIEQDNWEKALSRASEGDIQLFEDPYFSKQTSAYWERVTQETSRLKEAATEAIREAQAVQREAKEVSRAAQEDVQKATQEARNDLHWVALRTAFFGANQALLELETGKLAGQIEIIADVVKVKIDEFPNWVKQWLTELQQDLAWLQGVTSPRFESEQERTARVEELVKEKPDSRLAALWYQHTVAVARPPQDAFHQEYGQTFAHLARQLKGGRIDPFLSDLARIRDNLRQSEWLDIFQRLFYTDALAVWRRRADQWQALHEVVVEAQSEAQAVAESPPIARDERLVKADQLRQALRRLMDYLNNTPPEIFACASNDEKGSTLAEQWQQAVALVVKQIATIRRELYPTQVIEQQIKEWDKYQTDIQAYTQRRREEGEKFFNLYAEFDRSSVLARSTTRQQSGEVTYQ